jgi:hypothetical protein
LAARVEAPPPAATQLALAPDEVGQVVQVRVDSVIVAG